MIVAVLGASNFEKVCLITKKKPEEVRKIFRDIGKALAEADAEILIVPEEAMMPLTQSYKKNKGRKLLGAIPKHDKIWGYSYLKTEICDEEVDCVNWIELPYHIVEKADVILVVSLGTGVFAELTFAKYLHKFLKKSKRIIAFTPLLREKKLPIEIEYDIREILTYVSSAEELKKALKK